MMNSVASISTLRSRCGVAKNTVLKKHLVKTGQQIRIDISSDFMAPLDNWCPAWTQELNIICRQYAPITASSWPRVIEAQRGVRYGHSLRRPCEEGGGRATVQ